MLHADKVAACLPGAQVLDQLGPDRCHVEADVKMLIGADEMEAQHREGLFEALIDRFGRIGGVQLELPARATPTRAADLSA